MERATCLKCTKEFSRLWGERLCAVCADPEGFRRFCEGLDKGIRELSVRQERESKKLMREKFTVTD